MHLEDYRAPGILTDLTPAQREIVARVDGVPVALCRAAQSVLVLPELARASGVDESRASGQVEPQPDAAAGRVAPESGPARPTLSISDAIVVPGR